ncbi:hypothetical protein MVEN_02191600 [Mycena venus]|uniref:Uncharacterized protein n=1 Tax=Mycena venus TaxID=2733690 RepID=A0A8H6X797_9AGAR|nr:hypothetical protein MVEN_02191600 [Mycena venus]
MRLSFIALVVVLASASFVTSQVASPVTDTVPFSDAFPTPMPTGTNITLDEEFDGDSGTSEANTTSTLPNGTDPDATAFGEIFIYSPNENAVSSLDDTDTDWVIPASACDATSEQPQTVPMYCSSNLKTSTCAHVMIGGAENTIVKMPASCGAGPYARIASLNIHPNPSALGLSAAELAQKPASEPVYLLSFDYDFTAIPEDNAPVYMRADMSDMPGYWDEVVDAPDDGTRKRGIRVSRELEHMVEPRWGGSFTSWLKKVTTVQQKATATRSFNWQDTDPPTFTASLGASLTGSASLNAQYGFYLEATVVPPAISSAYVFVSAASAVKGQFALTGKAAVTYNSQKDHLRAIWIPWIVCVRPNSLRLLFPPLTVISLCSPGLITVGPSLVIQGYIQGQLSLDGQFTTSVSRNFPAVSFSLGKSSPDVFGAPVAIASANQGINLQAGFDVALSGDLSIHAVPSIQLGLNVLNGQLMDAQAGAVVDVDLYGGVHFNGSVSSAQAPQFCIGAYYGVSVDVGLQGNILYWEPTSLTHNFFATQQEIFGKCFASSSNPSAAGNVSLTGGTPLSLAEAVDSFGLDSAPGSAFLRDTNNNIVFPTTGSGVTTGKRATVSQIPGNLGCPIKS